jgi:hypothetical protein
MNTWKGFRHGSIEEGPCFNIDLHLGRRFPAEGLGVKLHGGK